MVWSQSRKYTVLSGLFGGLALATAIFSGYALRHWEMNTGLRALISVLPALPSVLYVLAVVWWTRQLDELQRRIQLEATSIAFAGTAAVTITYGCLQKGGFVAAMEWKFIWSVMLILWLGGWTIASRRYQ